MPLVAMGAIAAAGSLGGALIQSHAAGEAADTQAKAAADTLAFQKQQAENQYQNDEANRRANWQQYFARQQGNNTIRQALGLSPINIPAYVPSIDPKFNGSSGSTIASTVPPQTGFDVLRSR